MDGIWVNFIEFCIGALIYKPFRNFVNKIIIWAETADLDEESMLDFLRYHFPQVSEYIDNHRRRRKRIYT